MLKSIVLWITAGATLLAAVAAGVAYFDLSPAERAAMWGAVGRVVVWVGLVGVLPWATCFVTTAAARRESNAVGAALVAGYTIVDAAVFHLLVGPPASTFSGCAVVLGLLLALTYNLLTCDWIAERAS